jgi:F-type H+-transporting ATPase subunit delta
MSELTVASRYAKSLIDLAEEQNAVDAVKTDMDFFLKTLKQNPQLSAVVANPIISHSKKTGILNDLFGSKVNKLTIAFFNIMVNKGRGEVLQATASEYINQFNVKRNIIKAQVTSATPLSAANRQKLTEEVEQAIGSKVILVEKVDPALIGGFVLAVGDRQIDTSIAAELKRLKKDFAQKTV